MRRFSGAGQREAMEADSPRNFRQIRPAILRQSGRYLTGCQSVFGRSPGWSNPGRKINVPGASELLVRLLR